MSFEKEALKAGFNAGLILDYLDQEENPKIEGLASFQESVDEDWAVQARWDAESRQEPINVSGYQGNPDKSAQGFGAMVDKVRRGS